MPLLTKRNLFCFILVSFLFFSIAFSGDSFAQSKAEKIDKLLTGYFDKGMLNGSVLVAEKGELLFKKGYGLANMEWNIPNRPDTKFRLGSITKQFTSMIIMQLVAEGKISIEGKLSDYLHYYRKDTGDKITVHHLLSHTSGIPSYTSMPDFFEKVSKKYFAVKDFVQKYCSGGLEFEEGTQYKYNNSGYFILGAIIEQVTGKKYENVLTERILKPLNMKNTGYDHHENILPNRAGAYQKKENGSGYENAPYLDMSLPYSAGSLYSTVEDLFIWDRALYKNELLKKKYKKIMFTPFLKNYAYGWIITKDPSSKKAILHGGGINGFNTILVRLVEDRHFIVLLNNTGGTKLNDMAKNINRILYDIPVELPGTTK